MGIAHFFLEEKNDKMANHWYSRIWVNFYNCFTFHFTSISLAIRNIPKFPKVTKTSTLYIQTSFQVIVSYLSGFCQ